MPRPLRAQAQGRVLLAVAALLVSGCQLTPRQELETCRQLGQTLRVENSGLKDQIVVLKSQNEDLSERAVDDTRRLAMLESSNERLEASVQAYQDERTKLEDSYRELKASLPGSPPPVGARDKGRDAASTPDEELAAAPGHEPVRPARGGRRDAGVKKALNSPPEDRDDEEPPKSSTRGRKAESSRDAWRPARPASSKVDPATRASDAAGLDSRSGPAG